MPHIEQLAPHVADLIAAGEVVERPASVVKELLENAIDAGASAVTVEIQNGGMTYIRVADNGCGIAPEELPTAFLRHATSKLRTAQDLAAIGTLGFRGEALAAISAVSRMDVFTRQKGAQEGATLSLEGGVPGTCQAAGCPEGTTMVVRDLFYNTPARLKFMKKDAAEASTVAGVVQHLSLSNPHISFQLIKDGSEVLHTPGDNKLSSAIYAALGRDFALGLQEVDGSGEGIAVRGYVTAPLNGRGTRGMQIFFVNGRYVKSQLLSAAVEEAYKNQMMKGKFPGCVLHVELPKEWVDVNVHPAKTVVKFVNDRQVFSAVYHVVQDTLDRPNTPAAGAKPAGQVVNPRGDFYQQMDAKAFREKYDGKGGQKTPVKAATPFVTKIPPADTELGGRVSVHDVARPRETAPQPARQSAFSPAERPLGTFAPVSSAQRFAAQEAAWPREEKSASAASFQEQRPTEVVASPIKKAGMPVSVGPDAPETIQEEAPQAAAVPAPTPETAPPVETGVTAEPEQQRLMEEGTAPWRLVGEVLRTYIIAEDGDTVWLIDKHAAHERMNFDRLKANTEPIMGQQLLCPEAVKLEPEDCAVLLDQLELLGQFGFEAEDFGGDTILVRSIPSDIDAGQIRETLEMLAEKLRISGTADPETVRDAMLHTMACKAAIKGGWVSDKAELQVLVDKVQSGEVRYCPHGRPVAVKLSKYELEKMFKRA